MAEAAQSEVTQLLRGLAEDLSPEEAADRILPLVYEELRVLAGAHLRRERGTHTLQATEIVHEAYLKLAGQLGANWTGRRHFFGVAGRAMRQVLVDHARRRQRRKRGGGIDRVTLHEDACQLDISSELSPELLLDLDQALDALRGVDPRQAQVVELRCFVGLKVAEIAETLGVSRRTVEGDWTHARAWLKHRLASAWRS